MDNLEVKCYLLVELYWLCVPSYFLPYLVYLRLSHCSAHKRSRWELPIFVDNLLSCSGRHFSGFQGTPWSPFLSFLCDCWSFYHWNTQFCFCREIFLLLCWLLWSWRFTSLNTSRISGVFAGRAAFAHLTLVANGFCFNFLCSECFCHRI